MVRMLGNRGVLLALLTAFGLLLAGALISCGEDEVDLPETDTGELCAFCLDDDGGGGGGGDDDGAADDDAGDDDATDDDAGDDDDTWSPDAGGPEITDATWDPAEISIESGDLTSYFGVWLCDAEGDLQVDETWGDFYMWQSGTTGGFLTENPMSLSRWASVFNAGDVTDCDNPVKIAVQVGFTGSPPGEYCADVGITDGNGNQSQKKTNICVNVVP